MFKLKLAFFVAAGFAAASFLGKSLQAQSATPIPETSSSKTTEQVFKNIQVLKGVPSDQLIPAMQFITSSLGVQCDFCHMHGAFDKDDKKPKQIARKMMQMMIIINQENFDSHREVTCFTCHRGSPKAVAIPIIGAEAIPPFPQGLDDVQAAANLPAVAQILDKYTQAAGGLQSIGKAATLVEHGQVSFGPRQFPVDIFDQSPDKYAVVMHLPSGENITVLNGAEGWSSAPGRPVHPMSSSEIAATVFDADAQFPADAARVFQELKVEREEKLGDRPAYVVVGARKGLPPTRLYFDEQSGLLVREMRYADSPLGLNPTQIDYGDYRDQGGIKLPFQRTISLPRGRSMIQIDKIELNVPIDASRFAKPAASAAPEKPY